jgi:hypothetical protein
MDFYRWRRLKSPKFSRPPRRNKINCSKIIIKPIQEFIFHFSCHKFIFPTAISIFFPKPYFFHAIDMHIVSLSTFSLYFFRRGTFGTFGMEKFPEKLWTTKKVHSRYVTKIQNCSRFMRVDQFLIVWSLLSPKIIISP